MGAERVHEPWFPSPPEELLDPDGEGIYLLNDPTPWRWGVLLTAAWRLFGNAREWRNVDHASIGKRPFGWRLNLPKRWRPVAYAYCTPKPENSQESPS
jgi:hypothetical protein